MREVRRLCFQTVLACTMVASVAAVSTRAQDGAAPVEPFLLEGQLTNGAKAMKDLIEGNPDDQQARFSLGVLQFLQAVEGLGQDQYRYGLLAGRARSIPLMRLPISENKTPEEISYAKARTLVQKFVDRLKVAEETLRDVKAENLKLPLKVGAIRLDLNGDGEVPNEESMWHITQTLQNPGRPTKATAPQPFPIVFDAGDVPWLQGYCHALTAVCEIILAHDWQDQFERTAHLFYPKVDTPYDFLVVEGPGAFMSFGPQNLLDFIAWVHTINYDVVEPERMGKALTHMEIVIKLSRESWALIEAETDDENEWVPNADQKSVMKGFTVGREIISGWHEFLDEMEDILQGETLVPFWRGVRGGQPLSAQLAANTKIGINVRKIFTEPTRFDLALWLQGTGLTPYLEEGKIVSGERWTTIMRSFRGNFFNFFFWFN